MKLIFMDLLLYKFFQQNGILLLIEIDIKLINCFYQIHILIYFNSSCDFDFFVDRSLNKTEIFSHSLLGCTLLSYEKKHWVVHLKSWASFHPILFLSFLLKSKTKWVLFSHKTDPMKKQERLITCRKACQQNRARRRSSSLPI